MVAGMVVAIQDLMTFDRRKNAERMEGMMNRRTKKPATEYRPVENYFDGYSVRD